MGDIDWHQLFIPSRPLAETILRGTVVYLGLFLAMRFLPRRTIGATGPTDLLVVVLIADAVQQGMAGDYKSITEALVLAAVIFGWAMLIDFLDARFPRLRLSAASALLVIEHGRFIDRNMKRHNLTRDELLAELRQYGLDSPEGVARAFIEGDGRVSVILASRAPLKPPKAGLGF
jgi:uncharacterized membrane protein YcaP (DUF421 family)